MLFADVRHYHADLGIWDLCNSGQHATWFAARSDDPAENMRHVHLYPEEFYFPAGGASVHHLAAPGDFTFARLTRLDGRYRMQVLRGALEQFDDETNERLMRASTYVWPHAFARFEADADEFLGRYGSNHIHAVPGRPRRGAAARLPPARRRLRRLRRRRVDRAPPRHRHRHRVDARASSARPTGAIVARAAREHDVSMPRPGWFEHDAEDVWWSDVVALCRELLPGRARDGRGRRHQRDRPVRRAVRRRPTRRCGRRSSTASTPAPRRRSTS